MVLKDNTSSGLFFMAVRQWTLRNFEKSSLKRRLSFALVGLETIFTTPKIQHYVSSNGLPFDHAVPQFT